MTDTRHTGPSATSPRRAANWAAPASRGDPQTAETVAASNHGGKPYRGSERAVLLIRQMAPHVLHALRSAAALSVKVLRFTWVTIVKPAALHAGRSTDRATARWIPNPVYRRATLGFSLIGLLIVPAMIFSRNSGPTRGDVAAPGSVSQAASEATRPTGGDTLSNSEGHVEDFEEYLKASGYAALNPLRAAKVAEAVMYGDHSSFRQASAQGSASLKELYQQNEQRRAELRSRRFVIDVSERTRGLEINVENWADGVAWVVVQLPFMIEAVDDQVRFRCKTLQASYRQPAFLTKRGTLQPIGPEETHAVRAAGGVVYLKRYDHSALKIRVPMSAGDADRYSVNGRHDELTVRVFFDNVWYNGPQTGFSRKVVYYRQDLAEEAGTLSLDRGYDVGINGPSETPFVFETAEEGRLEYVNVTVRGWEVLTKDGAVVDRCIAGTK